MVGVEGKSAAKKGTQNGVMSSSRSGSRNGTVRINCTHAQNQMVTNRDNHVETFGPNYIESIEQNVVK